MNQSQSDDAFPFAPVQMNPYKNAIKTVRKRKLNNFSYHLLKPCVTKHCVINISEGKTSFRLRSQSPAKNNRTFCTFYFDWYDLNTSGFSDRTPICKEVPFAF